ncbi:hypothetical protein GQ44DRAFT_778133 [Phaeosphaeriaceae sp. PMI808]|nr:hypothetical protein GQ44DRAFT_778133 [Phaeosphaeriaceae sp. PMI808]
MDELSLELTSLIAGQLLERSRFDPSRQSLSETDSLVPRTDVWLTHLEDSVQDICNFRLVNHSLYNSSHVVFGELLGTHRVFRKTKVGMNDLQAMANIPDLRPHIRMLTFGNSNFYDPLDQRIPNGFMQIPEEHRTRLQDAYMRAARWWLMEGSSSYIPSVEATLRKFSNLRKVRLLHYECPWEHLEGWLDLSDYDLTERAWNTNDHLYLRKTKMYKQERADTESFRALGEAIRRAGTAIESLQIGHELAISPSVLMKFLSESKITSTLRHVSLELDSVDLAQSFTANAVNDYGTFFNSLNCTNITSLSLVMDPFSRPAHQMGFTLATRNLLAHLEPIAGFKQLAIRGEWSYSEGQLVHFISAHSENLTQFVLRGPSWWREAGHV